MYRSLSRKRRFGFTLVEVLVTTVVVGVMAAVVVPSVVKHSTSGDSARVASDLGAVKSGIEVFAQSVRPRMPGDVEDLINTISVSDGGLDNTVYSQANIDKWKGPYLEWTAGTDDAATDVFKSGGNAIISRALYRCPAAQTAASYSSQVSNLPCIISTASTAVTDPYVAVRITGIPVGGNEFANLNAIIDGAAETSSTDFGLLRQNASGTVFFLATPYTAP